MTSKTEFLEELRKDILEWARQLAAEYQISMEDAMELVKALIRSKIDS